MNKRLLFLCLYLLMSIAVYSQTFVCDTVLFYVDGELKFDYYSNYYLRDYIVLEVQEEDSGHPWYGGYGATTLNFRDYMDYYSIFNVTLSGSPYRKMAFSDYELTLGRRYRIGYRLPSNFRYKMFCHNPYPASFSIGIYGESPLQLTSYLELATINVDKELYVGEYWLYTGKDSIGDDIHCTDWIEFTYPYMNYISGTTFFLGIRFYD